MVYRMQAEVAGAFLLHCHLQPHAVMGMATVLLVGIDALPALPTNFTQEFAYVRCSLPFPAASSCFALMREFWDVGRTTRRRGRSRIASSSCTLIGGRGAARFEIAAACDGVGAVVLGPIHSAMKLFNALLSLFLLS